MPGVNPYAFHGGGGGGGAWRKGRRFGRNVLKPRVHIKKYKRKGYKPGVKGSRYYKNVTASAAARAFDRYYLAKYPTNAAKRQTAKRRDIGRRAKPIRITKSAKYVLNPSAYDYPGFDDGQSQGGKRWRKKKKN